MMVTLAVAAGGAVGAALRFWTAQAVLFLGGRDFPYATLLVNVLGSFLIGALYVLLVERYESSNLLRGALITGLLGGFTTFSSFSFETLALVESAQPGKALVNILGSVIGCLFACWVGAFAARQL